MWQSERANVLFRLFWRWPSSAHPVLRPVDWYLGVVVVVDILLPRETIEYVPWISQTGCSACRGCTVQYRKERLCCTCCRWTPGLVLWRPNPNLKLPSAVCALDLFCSHLSSLFRSPHLDIFLDSKPPSGRVGSCSFPACRSMLPAFRGRPDDTWGELCYFFLCNIFLLLTRLKQIVFSSQAKERANFFYLSYNHIFCHFCEQTIILLFTVCWIDYFFYHFLLNNIFFLQKKIIAPPYYLYFALRYCHMYIHQVYTIKFEWICRIKQR